MTKHTAVFITSLTALLFLIGCTEVPPEPARPPKAEPPKIEPSQPEPNMPEPNEPRPIKVEPSKPKPPPIVSFHDKCADTLKNFVDDKGMVDYRTLKRKKLELKALLDDFDNLDPNVYNAWPKEDKIAFWINAYNIRMLKIILDNYPIKSTRFHRLIWPPNSIRHIPPRSKIGASKWNEHKFLVMDEQFTLAEIELRFFHKQFDEPRIFLAITQASISGPPLRNQPYYGYKLYEQLNDQTKNFLSRPHAFRIDRSANVVYLSTIFQPTWYGKYFIHKHGTDKMFKDHPPAVRAVLNFVTNYISEQDISFLQLGNYSVKYIKYDWRLNE